MGRYPREREVKQVKPKFLWGAYDWPRPSSVQLIFGKCSLSENPGEPEVWASRCYGCKRRVDRHLGRYHSFKRGKKPVLVTRHHSVPLEMWYCEGCDVLIRVELKAN